MTFPDVSHPAPVLDVGTYVEIGWETSPVFGHIISDPIEWRRLENEHDSRGYVVQLVDAESGWLRAGSYDQPGRALGYVSLLVVHESALRVP
jgi:hypothetical protein